MTIDVLSNNTNKHFEINNSESLCYDISQVKDILHSNDIRSIQKALHYYYFYEFNVIPIPKPGEIIGKNKDEKEQKHTDQDYEIADGKSAKGYGSWREFQNKRQTPEDIIRIFKDKNEDCNIAIITGTVSKIIVFDIDDEEAEKYFDEVIQNLGDEVIKNAIKNTMQTKTGSDNGKHIIIGFNPEEIQNEEEKIKTRTLWIGKEKNHSEIKIKSEGSYIVAPNSLHISGNRYHFLNKAKPIILSKNQIQKISAAFGSKQNERFTVITSKHDDNHDKKDNGIYKVLTTLQIEKVGSILQDYYKEGHRDDIVFGIAGLLFKSNIALSSAQTVVIYLSDSTHDLEKNSRLQVLKETYFKGLNGQNIIGSTQLIEVLTKIISGNTDAAIRIVKKILQVLRNEEKDNRGMSNDDNNVDTQSATQILIQLTKENTSLLFRDQYDNPYAKIQISNHSEIMSLESRKFECYVSKLYYDHTLGKVASQDAINNAIRVLKAQALFDGPNEILHLRVAWGTPKNNNEEIYYDLANLKWQCIKITQEGWSIIQDSPVLFIRFNQKPQVEPDRNYSQDIVDRFLDLMHVSDRGHRLLTKVWIISMLIPDLPHPISITFGEKGGSKSTFCRFVKRLVDPDKIELLTTPKDKSEFVQQLYHNYLAVYDNVKQLPPWFSDEACKAITGVGNSKRSLYTNDEDVIYKYKRCLMVNGINNSLTEPDALDRSILTEFERIPSEQRREEGKIQAEFEEMRSKLLGYILDILAKALKIKPNIELNSLPRMADFAVWGESIARAMGYNPMEFINAYNENIGRQNIEAIESNSLCQALEKFVDSWYKEGKEACWQSPTSKVLENLNKVAQSYNIDTSKRTWPKAVNSFTKRLRPILSNLRDGLGIHITISRNTAGKNKNTSTMRIWKVSPLPPLPPLTQNQAQNHDENGGGILASGDSTSTQLQIPPPEKPQIHAQNIESGDDGGSGGILQTLEEKANNNDNENILSKRYVAFDFEWSQNSSSLLAAAFADSDGSSKTLHLSDYLNNSNTANSEADLLKAINQELLKYDFSVGWYSTGIARYHEDTQEYLDGFDSDLVVLHNRCVANDVEPIVDFNNGGVPYIRGQIHIDLCNVFGKPMVQTTIFKNKYRTLKLDDVSKAVLSGEGQSGKYKQLTGIDIQSLSIEEQKKYVLRDAELVMALSKHNNSEILDCMLAISELTSLSFEKVCRTGISTWWQAIFDNMISNGECIEKPLVFLKENQQELEHNSFMGATVLQPKKGLYHNLAVVDVSSLYPTMAILYNISFDTVNCECCKNDHSALVEKEIIKDCKIEKVYWICKLRKGVFPKKLRVFREERLNQKKHGNTVKHLALKILINGGYGVFGSKHFKYYDPRVAELITAYGRYTINRMQEIAANLDFKIVYGDTDSLFLYHRDWSIASDKNIDDIILKLREECSKQLGIEVEHTRTYQTALISDKKKHYIGWTGKTEKELDIAGMEGKKSNQPKWINDAFTQLVNDIIIHNTDPLPNLKKAICDLEAGDINPELLKRSSRLTKNPEEYENENDRKRKIGLSIGARKGDVIEYFDSETKAGYSLKSVDISSKKYKTTLWKAVRDILEIAGYDIAKLEQEIIFNNKDGHIAKPPRTAWLDSSIQRI